MPKTPVHESFDSFLADKMCVLFCQSIRIVSIGGAANRVIKPSRDAHLLVTIDPVSADSQMSSSQHTVFFSYEHKNPVIFPTSRKKLLDY